MLGTMYNSGRGVQQDYKAAVKWYALAAGQGHADAQNNLGAMYYSGRGVPQDYKAAVKWHTLAAEQGHATAQTNLGYLYAAGRGVTQDYVYAHNCPQFSSNGCRWQLSLGQSHRPSYISKRFLIERHIPIQPRSTGDSFCPSSCLTNHYRPSHHPN